MAQSRNSGRFGWRSKHRSRLRIFTRTLNANILGSTDWIRMILPLFVSPYLGAYRRKKIIGIQPLDLEIHALKDRVRILGM